MNNTTTDRDPERWSSLSTEGGTVEHGLGRALRVVAAETAMSASAFPAPYSSTVRIARAPRSRWLAPASLLALTGGVALAAWAIRTGARPAEVRSAVPAAALAPAPAIVVAPPTQLPATLPPAPPPLQASARRAPDLRASDAQLLWSAFRLLRQRRDGTGALAKLDEHRRRFPNSTLRVEAELGRAEALVLLGRRSQAAQVIDGLPVEVAEGARQRFGIAR